MPKTEAATRGDVWLATGLIIISLLVFDALNWYAPSGSRETAARIDRIEQKVNQPCR